MGVELTLDRVTRVLHVCGEIDVSCEAEFTEACRALLESGTSLTLDLRDVTFMDSSGVKALIHLARSHPCPITIVGARPQVDRLFAIVNIERRLPTLRIVRAGDRT